MIKQSRKSSAAPRRSNIVALTTQSDPPIKEDILITTRVGDLTNWKNSCTLSPLSFGGNEHN